VRNEGLGAFLDEMLAEIGPISEADKREAEADWERLEKRVREGR
jgi:hypothetical protein